MLSKYIPILSLLLISFAIKVHISVKNKYLFTEPDLNIEEISDKWRQLCGYHEKPFIRQINYKSKCFGSDSTKNMSEQLKERKKQLWPSTRIKYGFIADVHESPWTVQLTIRMSVFGINVVPIEHRCTGVLITMKHILITAQCYQTDWELSVLEDQVLFVGNNLPYDQRYQIQDKFVFYIHPKWRKKSSDGSYLVNDWLYDIGVIVLNKEIDISKFGDRVEGRELLVNTICLPKSDDRNDREYRPATFFGWGRNTDNKETMALKRGDILVSHGMTKDCPIKYCFTSKWKPGSITSCYGDAGAGLVQYLDQSANRAVLIGLVSRAEQHNRTTLDCVEGWQREIKFTNVFKHIDWIKEVIRNTTHK